MPARLCKLGTVWSPAAPVGPWNMEHFLSWALITYLPGWLASANGYRQTGMEDNNKDSTCHHMNLAAIAGFGADPLTSEGGIYGLILSITYSLMIVHFIITWHQIHSRAYLQPPKSKFLPTEFNLKLVMELGGNVG